jgi:Peptidase MA superfamily
MRRMVVATIVAGLLVGVSAAPAAAAGFADFGTPSAVGSFGGDIVFKQPVTVSGPIGRVELLVTFADALGPTVFPIPRPSGSGPIDLTYTLSIADQGHILPNTPIRARWRIVGETAGGSTTGVPAPAIGPEASLVYADARFDWKSASGDIVRVHWYEGGDAFGQRALKIGEDAVEQAAKVLGVHETEPVDFFIYADQRAFYDALGPGTRENVGGEADAGIRTLFALITPSEIDDAWVETVIPHELTHLVFDTAVHNPYHFPPRWLNEGLAVYESEGFGSGDRGIVEHAAGDGSLIPLPGLSGQFPTSGDRFRLAYAESVSAIDFLVRTHGQDALVALIGSYADGKTDDGAFEAAIGQDVEAFNAAWLADLGADAPARFGPLPAPGGPLPPGWAAGPAASARPGATAGPVAPTSPTPSTRDSMAGGIAIALVLMVLGVAGLAWHAARRRRSAAA